MVSILAGLSMLRHRRDDEIKFRRYVIVDLSARYVLMINCHSLCYAMLMLHVCVLVDLDSSSVHGHRKFPSQHSQPFATLFRSDKKIQVERRELQLRLTYACAQQIKTKKALEQIKSLKRSAHLAPKYPFFCCCTGGAI